MVLIQRHQQLWATQDEYKQQQNNAQKQHSELKYK
jgi:hypothetical protein